jgi:hypothetical protein
MPNASQTIAPVAVTAPMPDAAVALHRALNLLRGASPDWRHRGPTDGTDRLYWPCAIAAAQAHIKHALHLMERS